MYQLTCRAREKGRGLISVTPAGGSPDPAAAGLERWVVLVHGFNNSWKAASATWRVTVEELKVWHVDLGAVVLFYWPGDYSRWQVRSAMNYPRTVPIAEETAKLLARYLQRTAQDRRRPLQLSFVAHSLGSLVVLETIRLLRSTKANVSIDDVLFMAAAVPEGFCLPGEAYGNSFSLETKEAALYSLDDGVLKRFFQVGQQIAQRFPESRRRAVGRSGGPGAGIGQRWATAVHMDSFGHSDYWRRAESIEHIACVISQPGGRSFPALHSGKIPIQSEFIRRDTLSADSLREDDYPRSEGMSGWLERPLEV